MSRESRFPHRLNPDRTIDSICRVCFATVASVVDEGELARHEAVHVCIRPIDLDKYTLRSYISPTGGRICRAIGKSCTV